MKIRVNLEMGKVTIGLRQLYKKFGEKKKRCLYKAPTMNIIKGKLFILRKE